MYQTLYNKDMAIHSKILQNYTIHALKKLSFFVHGWNDTAFDATERLDRVKMSLENNKYTTISLVGFSWPSNTDWPDAKHIAKDNGQKLAEFIIKYMDTCNSSDKQPQQQD
jgi:Alpha/beta hydrolase of unknown function (DUF900)